MDKVAQTVSVAKFSVEAFKEPRGFIKIISLILAIFAFATITSHETRSDLLVVCNEGKTQADNHTVTFSYGYHYQLTSVASSEAVPICNSTAPNRMPAYLYGDYSSSAQFFVFIGVMAFLFSLASVILYAFFDETYQNSDLLPKIDLIHLVVWTLLWLISSSAWADGLSNVKYYTNPGKPWITDVIPDCQSVKCIVTETGNFANANVSVMFGFLCTFVWGGSVWFVLKETNWYKDRYGSQAGQQQSPSSSQQPASQPPPYPAYPSRM